MKQYERFAEHMRRILDERGISITELARAVGFKSRNSLFRILNDQTSSEVENSFFHELKASGYLKLRPREWAKLEESLEISRVGLDDYMSNLAIRSLLNDPPAGAGKFTCYRHSEDGSVEEKLLSDVLDELAQAKKLTLTLYNCCNGGFLRTLADKLRPVAEKLELRVTHYFFAGKGEVVRNLMAAQPILYESWYQAYMMEPETCVQEIETVLRTNTILICTWDEQGCKCFEQMVMVDGQRIVRSKGMDISLVHLLDEVLKNNLPVMQPVKSDFHEMNLGAKDFYRTYTEHYRQLEHNCAIISLKPDVPINFIHPDILMSPVLDGFMQSNVAEGEGEMYQLVSALYDIQLKRYNNFFQKKKVTHTVFSQKAMERFVRTGKQTDHFFAIRPYTPAERKAILIHLRDQAAHNPYFWLYFLKNEEAEMRAEITMYEGKGVMFMQANTGYDLENDHSEALVNHPVLNATFRNFFMKDMLTTRVLPYQDTMTLLDEMIKQLG